MVIQNNHHIGWLSAPFLHFHELKGGDKVHDRQEYYAQLSFQSIEKYPQYAKNYHDVSLYYYAYKKDQETALEFAQKAVQLEPQSIEYRLTTSYRLRDLNRFQEAITVLEPVLTEVNDERALMATGFYYYKLQNYTKSLEIYQRINQNSPQQEKITGMIQELNELIKTGRRNN